MSHDKEDLNLKTYNRLRQEIKDLEKSTERKRRELEHELDELEKRHHLIRPFEDYYGVKKSMFDFNLNLIGK